MPVMSRVAPTPVAAPRLIACAREVAELLEITPATCASAEFAQVFSGNKLLHGMDPTRAAPMAWPSCVPRFASVRAAKPCTTLAYRRPVPCAWWPRVRASFATCSTTAIRAPSRAPSCAAWRRASRGLVISKFSRRARDLVTKAHSAGIVCRRHDDTRAQCDDPTALRFGRACRVPINWGWFTTGSKRSGSIEVPNKAPEPGDREGRTVWEATSHASSFGPISWRAR